MAGYTRHANNLTLAQLNGPLDALELQAEYQFGRGVVSGLALSAGAGLTLNIATGVMIGLKCTEIAATSVALADASTLWVWLDEDGNVTTTGTYTDPGGTYTCLGKVTTSGGAITAIDQTYSSGRISLWRWTNIYTCKLGEDLIVADLSAGTLKFKTAQALAFKGSGQSASMGHAAIVFPSDANYTTTATEREAGVWSVTGTITAVRNVVADLTQGAQKTVYNGTTGGFGIQIIGPSGTGVTIANSKTAIVRCDGTNWLRVTADNP